MDYKSKTINNEGLSFEDIEYLDNPFTQKEINYINKLQPKPHITDMKRVEVSSQYFRKYNKYKLEQIRERDIVQIMINPYKIRTKSYSAIIEVQKIGEYNILGNGIQDNKGKTYIFDPSFIFRNYTLHPIIPSNYLRKR